MTTAYYSSFYPAEDSGAKGSAAFLPTMTNAVVYLYRRSATALTDSDKPNGNVIYTFATATIDVSAVTNGWSVAIPSGTNPLYVVAATASEYTSTDTIASGEWTTPVILAQNGTNGTNGLNTATVFLFQRNNTGTAPGLPSTNLTYTFATGALTGTLNGWSQTAPDSSNGAYLFITTATAVSSSATYVITAASWAAVRLLAQDGTDGADAYTVYLTNETHTLPASSAGVVSSYAGASGSFAIIKNGTDVSSNFALSTVSGANPQNLTIAYSTNTYTVTAGFDQAEETASITIRATGSGAYSGVSFDKIFTLSKSKAGTNGTDGTSAKLINITSSRQIVTYDGAGNLLPSTGQDIVLTATKQNTTANVVWTLKDNKGNTLTATSYMTPVVSGQVVGDTVTMTAANFNNALAVNTATAVVITATCDGVSDVVTVSKVANGTNGTNGINGTRTAILELYRWSASAPTTYPSGTSTYTWATGAFTLPGTPNGWSLTPGAPVAGQTLYGIYVVLSNNTTTETNTVTWNSTTVYPLGVAGTDGINGTNGTRTAILEMYRWSSTVPTTFPSGTSTYTWATGQFTAPATANSWTLTPGTPTAGQTLYIVRQIYADTGTSATSSVTWSATSAFPTGVAGTNGTDGTDGTDGVSAPNITLTNESATILAYANGTLAVAAGTVTGLARMYLGTTDVTSSTSWSITSSSGGTATIDNTTNKGSYALATMTSGTANFTITGTYNGSPYSKVFTVTKVNVGYEIVATLPTTSLFEGRIVFLTSDDKLYRYNGTAWVSSVPAVDVTGQLTNAQIASIEAAKLTGTITNTQIADDAITTAKIAAGAITTNEIAANTITAADIAAGTITATQIAADTITANQIAANAITATELSTNAVTADKINAGAITAAKLAATNVITLSAQINDGLITNAKIKNLEVDSLKIAGNAVNTSKLNFNSAIKLDTLTPADVSFSNGTTTQILADMRSIYTTGTGKFLANFQSILSAVAPFRFSFYLQRKPRLCSGILKKRINVTASSNIVIYSNEGINPDVATITFTGSGTNLSSPTVKYYVNGELVKTGTGLNYTHTVPQTVDEMPLHVRIVAEEGGAEVASNTLYIEGVRTGSTVDTAIVMTKQGIVLPADPASSAPETSVSTTTAADLVFSTLQTVLDNASGTVAYTAYGAPYGLIPVGTAIILDAAFGALAANTTYYILSASTEISGGKYPTARALYTIGTSAGGTAITIGTVSAGAARNVRTPLPATIAVNTAITFSGTGFGNIIPNQTYYVKTKPNNYSFTISVTAGGGTVDLIDSSGYLDVARVVTENIDYTNSGFSLSAYVGNTLCTYSAGVAATNTWKVQSVTINDGKGGVTLGAASGTTTRTYANFSSATAEYSIIKYVVRINTGFGIVTRNVYQQVLKSYTGISTDQKAQEINSGYTAPSTQSTPINYMSFSPFNQGIIDTFVPGSSLKVGTTYAGTVTAVEYIWGKYGPIGVQIYFSNTISYTAGQILYVISSTVYDIVDSKIDIYSDTTSGGSKSSAQSVAFLDEPTGGYYDYQIAINSNITTSGGSAKESYISLQEVKKVT